MQPDRPQPVLDARSAPVAFALRNIADRKARGRYRAAATVEAFGNELEWTDAEGWRYQLEAPPRVTIAPKDNERAAATVDLKVWDTGNNLIFRDRIHAWDGFPVLVPDGTQHKEDTPTGKVKVSNFRESPLEAARSDLAHTVKVVTKDGKEPWVKAKPGTVSTFYASTDDNRVSCVDNTYSVARSGAGTLDDSFAANNTLFVGQYSVYTIWQSFVPFDTSAIADTDTVTDFTLSFSGSADGSNVDFVLEARIVDWGATIEGADFVAGADLGSYTLIASINSSAYSTSYMDFTTESGVTGQINLTGLTKVHLSSAEQRLNSAPTDFEYLQLNSADQTGTTKDPKLVVTHASATKPFRRALLGVGF